MGAKRSCYALPVLFLSFPFRVVLRTARDVLTALLPLRAAAAFKDKGLVVGSGAAASLEEKLFVAAGSAMATFLRCEIASRCAPSLLKPKQKNCAIRCCASSKMRVVSHGAMNHELIVIFRERLAPAIKQVLHHLFRRRVDVLICARSAAALAELVVTGPIG
jgi:hypothetical protein